MEKNFNDSALPRILATTHHVIPVRLSQHRNLTFTTYVNKETRTFWL